MKRSVVVNDITRLINLVKDVFPQQVDVEYVGKNGKCYQVALLLKHVYHPLQSDRRSCVYSD